MLIINHYASTALSRAVSRAASRAALRVPTAMPDPGSASHILAVPLQPGGAGRPVVQNVHRGAHGRVHRDGAVDVAVDKKVGRMLLLSLAGIFPERTILAEDVGVGIVAAAARPCPGPGESVQPARRGEPSGQEYRRPLRTDCVRRSLKLSLPRPSPWARQKRLPASVSSTGCGCSIRTPLSRSSCPKVHQSWLPLRKYTSMPRPATPLSASSTASKPQRRERFSNQKSNMSPSR